MVMAVFFRFRKSFLIPGYPDGRFPFAGYLGRSAEEMALHGSDPMVRHVCEHDPQFEDPVLNGAIMVQVRDITATEILSVGHPELSLVPGVLPWFLPTSVGYYLEIVGVLRRVTVRDGDAGLIAGVAYWTEHLAEDNDDVGAVEAEAVSDGGSSDGDGGADYFPVGFYGVVADRR